MSLVITGAAGHLGRTTAERLLDRVDPERVVLVTRHPEELADLAERGATVRHGDFDDPASLVATFEGAERLLLISTDALGRRLAQHAAAIDAARAAGAELVAYTSMSNPVAENPAAVAGEHRATEEAVQASGLQWTFLRNALYSEYRIPEAQGALASGVFHHNQGDGRTAYVSREDCAAAAAAVLAGGDEHAGKAYDITGPELLGGTELAGLYAEVGEAPVASVAVDDAGLIAGMHAAGIPQEVATMLASFGTAIRNGYLNQLSTAVQDLTGRAPRTLRETLQEAMTTAARAA
jgi:NAD(P)H dehydrogenase (quinone)